ncbi:MAG TPA: SAM-dependent methyltransferase [Alphaproteobacteria bacterium]|nr:SAM-dependent methyltransferase [Alphaproteobacteria bacterium]
MNVGSEPGKSVIEALEHYESQDADRFYQRVWAGGDLFIGIGIYQSAGDTVYDACRRTVAKLAALLLQRGPGTPGLELGSGYGAAARYLAKEREFQIDCLNLSPFQNRQNGQINHDQNLQDRIRVVAGTFEDIPFGEASYEVVWSQDSFIHSANRRRVLEEINRVLRPGGDFVFTDLIQDEDCPPEVLQPVLSRFHLDGLATVRFYRETAKELGWRELQVFDLSRNLVTHYERLLQELERRYDELLGEFKEEYLKDLRKGMQSWVTAGKEGNFKWAMFHYRNL